MNGLVPSYCGWGEAEYLRRRGSFHNSITERLVENSYEYI